MKSLPKRPVYFEQLAIDFQTVPLVVRRPQENVNYCVKTVDRQIAEEGRLRAMRHALREWAGNRSESWRGAMETTLVSGWIYDTRIGPSH